MILRRTVSIILIIILTVSLAAVPISITAPIVFASVLMLTAIFFGDRLRLAIAIDILNAGRFSLFRTYGSLYFLSLM